MSGQEESKGSGKKSPKEDPEWSKKCEKVIFQLKKHPSAGQFCNLAVIPNYVEAVGDYMDLNTLEQRLKSGAYPNSAQFIADAKKIWNNTQRVTKPGTDLYNAAVEISNYFDTLMAELGSVGVGADQGVEPRIAHRGAARTAAPRAGGSGGHRKGVAERPMSSQEKAFLRRNIMSLPQEKLQGVIQIIQSSVDMPRNDDTLEFDIDKLPSSVARELDRYVKENLPEKKVPKKKTEPAPPPAKKQVKLCMKE